MRIRPVPKGKIAGPGRSGLPNGKEADQMQIISPNMIQQTAVAASRFFVIVIPTVLDSSTGRPLSVQALL